MQSLRLDSFIETDTFPSIHPPDFGSVRPATTMQHPHFVATTESVVAHDVAPTNGSPQAYALSSQISSEQTSTVNIEPSPQNMQRVFVPPQHQQMHAPKPLENADSQTYETSLPTSEPSNVSSTTLSDAYATAQTQFYTQIQDEDLPVTGTISCNVANGASFQTRSNETMPMKHPEYVGWMTRLQTFKDYPKSFPDYERLAKAGLYYTGRMDICCCFYCDLTLYEWNIDDDPFQEHLKKSNGCYFIKSMFDQTDLQRSFGGEGANERLPGVGNQTRQRATEGMYMTTGRVPNSNSNRLTRGGNVAIEQTEERNRTQLPMFNGDRGNANGINEADNVPRGRMTGQQGFPRKLGPLVCKVCDKHEIGVTLRRCGHIICAACVKYDDYGYQNCQICGKPVEAITAYDNSQLLKLAQ